MSIEITRQDGQWEVVVNGVDLTKELVGLTVESDPDRPESPPKVTLRMTSPAVTVVADDAQIITVPHEHEWVTIRQPCDVNDPQLCATCGARRIVTEETTEETP